MPTYFASLIVAGTGMNKLLIQAVNSLAKANRTNVAHFSCLKARRAGDAVQKADFSLVYANQAYHIPLFHVKQQLPPNLLPLHHYVS